MSEQPQVIPSIGPPRRRAAQSRSLSPGPMPGSVGAIAAIDPLRVLRQYLWWIVASVIIGAGVGAAAHVLLLRWSPIYTAEAFFEVNVPKDPKEIGSRIGAIDQTVKRTLNTQAANMIHPSVLRKAINSTEVRTNTTWIKKFTNPDGSIRTNAAADALEDRIRAVPIRESFRIRLSLIGTNKDDLRRILQAVVKVFTEDQKVRKQAERDDLSAPLSRRREDLRSRIDALETEIDTYASQHNIPDDPDNDPNVIEARRLVEFVSVGEHDVLSLQAEEETLRARLAGPTIDYSEVERAIAQESSGARELQLRIVGLKQALRAARERFGPSHRNVRGLEMNLRATEDQLEAEFTQALEQNLRIRLQQIRDDLARLTPVIAPARERLLELESGLADVTAHRRRLEAKESERDDLLVQMAELEKSEANVDLWHRQTSTDTVTLRQPPMTPTKATFPQLIVMVPLGILVFTGLTTGIVFLREITDRRVKGPSDIAILAHGRVLGVIPHLSEDPTSPRSIELLSARAPQGVIAESVRQIRNRLLRAMDQMGHKSLLLVGGQPGAGTSSLVANLAVSIANGERSVLVLDANFRRPRQAQIFEVDASPGLGEVLCGAATLDEAVKRTSSSRITVLPAGAGEFRIIDRLVTEKFASVIAQLGFRHDIILIDAPAAVAAADYQVLAHIADASILLVRALQEDRGLVARLIMQMREAHADHLGVVLNAVRSSAGGYFKRNIQQMAQYHHGPEASGSSP